MMDSVLASAIVIPLVIGAVLYTTYKIAKLFAPHTEIKFKG